MVIDPKVYVSWDGSGAFDGPNDDITHDVPSAEGFTVSFGRDGAQSLSPPVVAAGSTTVRNDTGRYSQNRADSPVYQRVLPGRPVRYQITYDAAVGGQLWRGPQTWRSAVWWRGAGVFPQGQHVLDSISQATSWGEQRVGFETLGYETSLTQSVVTCNLLTLPRVDECITTILNVVGWPLDRRNIAASDTSLSYWWCDERHPWDALLELLAAEGAGAALWVDGHGVIRFENRNYKITAARSTTSQATFHDVGSGASGLYFTLLDYSPNFQSIYNRATYATRRRAAGSLAAVWSYGAELTLSSGQTVTLIARPQDPFINAVTPVAGIDYTATGSGLVSVLLAATSGFVAYITVSAIGGSATLSDLQLRAEPLTAVSQTVVSNTLDQSESIERFSPLPGQNVPITLPLNGWPEIDPAQAAGVCDSWVARYSELRAQVTVAVRGADTAHIEQILRRIPGDRVTLVERNTGLEADFWINSVSIHVSGMRGTDLEARWGCERVDAISGARWDQDLARWDQPEAIWGI
jgi:hypothetical protein